MKKSFAPLVLMLIFALGLVLTSVCQTKSTTAKVSETAVFDYGENRFMSSHKGEVENHYTEATITKKGNKMVFVMKVGADSSYTSVYKITERKMGSRIILAKRVDTNAKIRIVQRRNSLEVMYAYNKEADRYDAAIVFTDVNFN